MRQSSSGATTMGGLRRRHGGWDHTTGTLPRTCRKDASADAVRAICSVSTQLATEPSADTPLDHRRGPTREQSVRAMRESCGGEGAEMQRCQCNELLSSLFSVVAADDGWTLAGRCSPGHSAPRGLLPARRRWRRSPRIHTRAAE